MSAVSVATGLARTAGASIRSAVMNLECILIGRLDVFERFKK
jgi:hypothetical protein